MLAITSARTKVIGDRYARDRATKTQLAFRLRVRARVVAQAVRRYGGSSPARLLEVGAAEGRTLLETAAILGPGEYFGVERNEALREAHPPLPDNVTLIHGDALDLPEELSEKSFDVVSLPAVLEHLSDPLKALREAYRVVRPGGVVVATCPNPFWDGLAGRLGLVEDSEHVRQVDLPRLCELVASAGFSVLCARRFMWAPVGILPYARIRVPPALSLRIDGLIQWIPGLRALCVNAYAVGRRPRQADEVLPSVRPTPRVRTEKGE